MPASQQSKMESKWQREFIQAQSREGRAEFYANERQNDEPRVSGLQPHYSVLYTGRRSNVDADTLDAGPKAEEQRRMAEFRNRRNKEQ